MKSFTAALALLLGLLPATRAVEIEGVTVPPTLTISSQSLALNGAGLRTFTLLMVPIKIYVAAFYSPEKLDSSEAAINSEGPLGFTFTFLRSVSQSDVAKAWRSQFEASNTHTYPSLQKDLNTFVGMFGPLSSGGVQMVQFTDSGTQIFDQGTLKGTITGRDFQLSFLSLWFGKNAVSPDLKNALLGQ